jgi:hypothetical protein
MRMTTKKKILGAAAVAGVVAASGSAFTGGGLSNTATQDQFVGGTTSQTVHGATLTAVSYTVAANIVTHIHLTFDAAATGHDVTVTFGGGTYTCGSGTVVDGSNDCTGETASNADGGLSVTVL